MQIYTVDAFAQTPFTGNQAAVCLLDKMPMDEWLLGLAKEMNYSETAFLIPTQADDADFHLRWFTPAYEVDLCGHATLASAHILWNENGWQESQLRFQTRSGVLTANRTTDRIELDFPATPPQACELPAEVLPALGIQSPKFCGRSRFDGFVAVESERELLELSPDFNSLRRADVRGVIVTASADRDGCDFVSRFFAPAAGVDEDPVTGSAHCSLAPYWSQRLGKTQMLGYQASSRGGYVSVTNQGDRILLGGTAITILRGELTKEALPKLFAG